MRARGLAFLTLVVLAAAAPPSAAALLTYHFSGQFSSTFGAAPAGLVGSPFAGTFTYDPLAGTSSAGADFAVYTTGSASVSITSVAGSGAIDAGAGNMGSRWDSLVSTATGGTLDPADEFAAGGASSFSGGLGVFQLITLQLVDGGDAGDPFGAPLSGPPSSLSLADIDVAELRLSAAAFVDGIFRTTASAAGTITCLSADAQACPADPALPEPAPLALLAAAATAAALTLRRRARA
ncbi:MAG: PEP-CTERM sorting domain-containing protein [Rubrivivax sp.]